MIINQHTKISTILKHHPEALETIISINKKFEKLKNPILRKLMAGRTSLSTAASMGGCSVEAFFQKLEPLGFEIERNTTGKPIKKTLPAFMHSIHSKPLSVLDVRPILDSGEDPLSIIMEKIKDLEQGAVLKIVNSFEPTPLILLLEKKGFQTYVDVMADDIFETYFYKTGPVPKVAVTENENAGDWETIIEAYGENIQQIDVRHLEMPQPMFTILEALEKLPDSNLLLVDHKRVPVYLFPELADRKFSYRVRETSGKVQLLIFKDHATRQ